MLSKLCHSKIAGLSAAVSARGWLARVAGVWTCDDVAVPPFVASETRRRRRAAQQALVSRHVARVRFRWTAMLAGVALAAGLASRAGLPLASTWMQRGPVPLGDWLVGPVSRAVLSASSSSLGGRDFSLPATHAEDYLKLHAAVGEAAAKVGCFTQVPDHSRANAVVDASSNGGQRPTWQASAPWRESSFMGFLPVERQWLLLPVARTESGSTELQGGSQRNEDGGSTLDDDISGDSSKGVAQMSAALQHHFRATLVLATKVGNSWQDGGRVHALALRLALVLQAAMSVDLMRGEGIGVWLAAIRQACAESQAVLTMGGTSGSSSSDSSSGDRFLRVGVLRRLQPKHYGSESDDDKSGSMPPFFIDTTVNPLLLLVLLMLAAIVGCAAVIKLLLLYRGSATHDPCLGCLVAYVNAREESRSVAALLKSLDAEVADALGQCDYNSDSSVSSSSIGDGNGTSSSPTSPVTATAERVSDVQWCNCRIIVTQGWLLVLRPRGMDAVRVEDVRIATPPRLVLRHSGSERVECVQLDIRREIPTLAAIARAVSPRIRPQEAFRLEVPREGFDCLQQAAVGRRRGRALANIKQSYRTGLAEQERTVSPHAASTSAATRSGAAADSAEMQDEQPRQHIHTHESLPLAACLGDCGAMANVRVTKQCLTCDERDGCACEPAWCANCLFAWWVEKNTTRLDAGEPPARRWQARCPTCRVFFCLDDVVLVGPLEAPVPPAAPPAANREPAVAAARVPPPAPQSPPPSVPTRPTAPAPARHLPRQEPSAQPPLHSTQASSLSGMPEIAHLAASDTSTAVLSALPSNEDEDEVMAQAIRMSLQESDAAAASSPLTHESASAQQPSDTTITGTNALPEGTTGGAPSPVTANELRQRRLKRFEAP